MIEVAARFFVPYPAVFRQRLLQWLRAFPCVAFLDSNRYKLDRFATYDCLAACADALVTLENQPFAHVDRLSRGHNAMFGYFGYDLKNKIERLHSDKPNRTGFPEACFFAADAVFELRGNDLTITASDDPAKVFNAVMKFPLVENEPHVAGDIRLVRRTPKKKYLQTVDDLRAHIRDGSFYEINYCQEVFCDDARINPDALFTRLNQRSAAPFSAYMKFNGLHVISASPERFLKRLGDKLVSQPIKGTIRRDLKNEKQDEALKAALRDSEKDKAENVMIVDLVRNDLNRVCGKATVNVSELFGIYSFPTLHHMISTVEGTLRRDVTLEQIFKAAFPMGSMTGAPKVEVMKAIEFYEDTARGVYSGCLGYVLPNGDFDFSVVIRTALWNEADRYLSYHTGGAITYDSDPESEYAECMLKAKAFAAVLKG